jgi:hypothetical protein
LSSSANIGVRRVKTSLLSFDDGFPAITHAVVQHSKALARPVLVMVDRNLVHDRTNKNCTKTRKRFVRRRRIAIPILKRNEDSGRSIGGMVLLMIEQKTSEVW